LSETSEPRQSTFRVRVDVLLLAYSVEKLPDVVHGRSFKEELIRFVPGDIQERTLSKDKFYKFLENEISQLLRTIRAGSKNSESESAFQM